MRLVHIGCLRYIHYADIKYLESGKMHSMLQFNCTLYLVSAVCVRARARARACASACVRAWVGAFAHVCLHVRVCIVKQ